MNMSTLAWTGILSCTLLVSGASAQQLKQPLSVSPVGFNYNNYQQGTAVPSPAKTIATGVEATALTPVAESGVVGSGAAQSHSAQTYYVSAPAAASCGCGPVASPSCNTCAPACNSCESCNSCGGCGGGCGGGCLSGICDCDLGDAWTLSGALHGDCPPCVNIGGWFQAGYHSENNGLFNNRQDELALHQGWLYAEKAATCDSRFGFRADIMYGIDGFETQAFGNPVGSWDFFNGFDHGDYAWAIPQLYAEFAVNENWTVRAGHFYTLVGYEVVTAPDNFFYSHAMTMFLSEPFTHTGVLATGSVTDDLTVYAGWTLGWDTGFDELNDGSSWLGGFGYTINDNASFTYISTGGNLGWRGDDAYSHSVVLDMSVSENLNWVVQSDVLRSSATGEDNIGINQYMLYSVTDCLGLGARIEWWKGDNVTGFTPHNAILPLDGSFSYYAATFGANVRPRANIVVRPEVRIDWSPAAGYDETYFGVDAIFTF